MTKQRIQSGGLNSFCRRMPLTALCVLTGCLSSGLTSPVSSGVVCSARARRPEVLEGRVEEMYLFLSQSAGVNKSSTFV